MRLARSLLLLAFLATASAWTPVYSRIRVQRVAVAAASPVTMFASSTAAKPKKAVVRKPVAKKPVAKKPVARKPVAKKPVVKKPVVKKPVAKKAVVKKAVVKKVGAAKPAGSGLSGLSALFAPKSAATAPRRVASRPKPAVRKPVVKAAVRPKPAVKPKPVVKPAVRKPVAGYLLSSIARTAHWTGLC